MTGTTRPAQTRHMPRDFRLQVDAHLTAMPVHEASQRLAVRQNRAEPGVRGRARLACLRLALVAVMLVAPAWSADVDDGLRAFIARDFDQAYDIWQRLSDKGDLKATYYLSLLYAQGKGVERDMFKAMNLLIAAAEGGSSAAQFSLGSHYQQGRWVERDESQAARWWLAAAEQGNVQAQHNLAGLYLTGRGVKKDESQARYWYKRAADGGSLDSAQILALLDPPDDTSAPALSDADEDTATESAEPVAAPQGQSGDGAAQPQRQVQTQAAQPSEQPPESGLAPGAEPEPELTPQAESTPDPQRLAKPATEKKPAVTEQQAATQQPLPTRAQTMPQAVPRAAGKDAGLNAWLMSQPANQYTLQLMAGDSLQPLERAMAGQQLQREHGFYRYKSKGKTYYGVAYGRFGSLRKAVAASSELPAELKTGSPWARKFSAIQKLVY